MKKIFVLIVVIISFVVSVFAQETKEKNVFKLSDVTISSGEGALSSGIFGSITIKNSDTKLVFEVSSSFVQTMYGWYNDQLFVSISGGYFNNTPWIGPMVVYSPVDWLTITTWEGVSAGKDGHPDIKNIQFYFAYNNAKINYWIFYAQYSLINFEKNIPNNLPGAGISIPFGGYKMSLGCDYSLRDKKSLFSGSLFIPLD